MFRNILIPLDLSGEAQPLVDAALAVAHPEPPRITLLHVIETIRDVDLEETEDFYQVLRERAEECPTVHGRELVLGHPIDPSAIRSGMITTRPAWPFRARPESRVDGGLPEPARISHHVS